MKKLLKLNIPTIPVKYPSIDVYPTVVWQSVIGFDKHALWLKLSMKIVMLFVDVIVMLYENIIVII
jgi:hypothetical protein